MLEKESGCTYERPGRNAIERSKPQYALSKTRLENGRINAAKSLFLAFRSEVWFGFGLMMLFKALVPLEFATEAYKPIPSSTGERIYF
jgi:hypothetical protein